jgi:hypothetical protein
MSTYGVGFRVVAPLGSGEGQKKTVNGNPWTSYDKDKETITLKGLTGTVAVTAQY